jgi:hypothetical protein
LNSNSNVADDHSNGTASLGVVAGITLFPWFLFPSGSPNTIIPFMGNAVFLWDVFIPVP